MFEMHRFIHRFHVQYRESGEWHLTCKYKYFLILKGDPKAVMEEWVKSRLYLDYEVKFTECPIDWLAVRNRCWKWVRNLPVRFGIWWRDLKIYV